MRTCEPLLRTLPVTSVATPSAEAISCVVRTLSLNCITDERERTLMPGTWATDAMMSSVIPSLKYASSGSAL